jgi:hypothetical protein
MTLKDWRHPLPEGHHSFTGLLSETSRWLDATDVLAIACADRGMEVQTNVLALSRIIELQRVPSPLAWSPREVLELTRWDEPNVSQNDNVRRHRRRAFASTVLLIAHGDPNSDLFASDDALIQLIFSLETLGAPLDRQAISLLRWLIPLFPEEAFLDRLYCGMGLLWFGLSSGSNLSLSDLSAVLDWILDAELQTKRGEHGVLLTQLRSLSQRHHKWQQLAPMLNARARRFFPTVASRSRRSPGR